MAHTSPSGIVFVSDRRVTQRRPNRPDSLFSDVENKTIIFHVNDAVGVIGYTGPAYIGMRPTDVWLASLVANQELSSVEMLRLGHHRNAGRLNPLIWRIKTAVEGLTHLRKLELTITLSGWRQRRRYMIPFTRFVSSQPRYPAGPMRLPQSPEHREFISQIGDRMLAADIDLQLREAIRQAGGFSLEAMRRGLMGAVRHRANESSLVGKDLMTVWIPPVTERRVYWRFEPNASHRAALDPHAPADQFEIAFSPWIISPIGIMAPAIGNTHFQPFGGGWAYLCMNDVNPEPVSFVGVRRQNRRRRP